MRAHKPELRGNGGIHWTNSGAKLLYLRLMANEMEWQMGSSQGGERWRTRLKPHKDLNKRKESVVGQVHCTREQKSEKINLKLKFLAWTARSTIILQLHRPLEKSTKRRRICEDRSNRSLVITSLLSIDVGAKNNFSRWFFETRDRPRQGGDYEAAGGV